MHMPMLKRPAVTPFVECPNCKRLLEYGSEMCPDCREEISAEYASISAAIIFHNTQACSSANIIKTGEFAALISIGASAYAFFLDAPALFIVSLFTPIMALTVILVWFYRFGSFKYGDEEFLRAKRDMHASLRLWAALLLVQSLVLLYLLEEAKL